MEVILRRSGDCAVCKLVRFYLLLAAPLLVILGAGALDSTGEMTSSMWFARVELIEFLSTGSVIALVVVISFKAYHEYWRPRRRARAIEELLKETSKKSPSE
jgi:hypothetical protein